MMNIFKNVPGYTDEETELMSRQLVGILLIGTTLLGSGGIQ